MISWRVYGKMSPNIWGENGLREGEYKRHSVQENVYFFVGWKKIDKLFNAFKTLESY